MKFTVRLNRNAYLMNCTITKLIKRVRKKDTNENYDLVEVECNDWKELRLVYFNGTIAIPEEFENNEISMWNVEQLSNSYNDISIDIANTKKALKKQYDEAATMEIQTILYDLQKEFNIKVNEMITSEK